MKMTKLNGRIYRLIYTVKKIREANKQRKP